MRNDHQRRKTITTRERQQCRPTNDGELRKQQDRGNNIVDKDRGLRSGDESINTRQLNFREKCGDTKCSDKGSDNTEREPGLAR
jgi:hypothetical protein